MNKIVLTVATLAAVAFLGGCAEKVNCAQKKGSSCATPAPVPAPEPVVEAPAPAPAPVVEAPAPVVEPEPIVDEKTRAVQ